MAHPTDTQVGVYLWDLELLDWRKVTLSDILALLESGPHYTKRFIYDVNHNVTYQGIAEPGSSTASAVWKIIKYTLSGNDTTAILFAEGSDSFSFVWDNYLSYNYI
jgi:hypothetical protein